MAKFHHECFDDPWVMERSRSMNAEIDAVPELDNATKWAIVERHVIAATEADPEKAERLGGWLEEGLMRAAIVDHPTHGRWGLVHVAEVDEGLEAVLDPIRQRQRAEFEKVYAIQDRCECFAASTELLTKHVEELRRVIEQWYAEKHARAEAA